MKINRLFEHGNGPQHANHKKAVVWVLDNVPGTVAFDDNHITINDTLYRVTYSSKPDKLMLANTKESGLKYASWMKDGCGLIAVRQFDSGKLACYKFESARDLWDSAARHGVTIKYDDARQYASKPLVVLPDMNIVTKAQE